MFQTKFLFIYDEENNPLIKVKPSGDIEWFFGDGIFSDGEFLFPMSIAETGHTFGYFKNDLFVQVEGDHLNSLIKDSLDQVNNNTPFGERTVRSLEDHKVLDYAKKGYDEDIEAVRMGRRYYDPKAKRFLTPDSYYLEEPDKILKSPIQGNLYSYAINNPINLIDPSGQDAIYVAYPDYKISTPIGKIGGLGHAGVLLIDNKSGLTKYYEYGRYDSKQGNVRTVSVPNVEIGKNGRPTSESMNKVMKTLSQKVGHGGKVSGGYIRNDNFKAMNDYAKGQLDQKNNSNRASYNICTNNCATFAKSTIEAGGVDMPMMIDPRPNSYVDEVRGSSGVDKVDYNPISSK